MFAYNHYTLTANLQTDSKSLSKFIKIVGIRNKNSANNNILVFYPLTDL